MHIYIYIYIDRVVYNDESIRVVLVELYTMSLLSVF